MNYQIKNTETGETILDTDNHKVFIRAFFGGDEFALRFNALEKNIFATGSIPDGYFGDTASISFGFDKVSGKTIAITKDGLFFTYHTPPAADVREAFWMLEHHPLSNVKGLLAV